MVKQIRVVAGLVLNKNRILLCQRPEDDPHPFKWEFPGGKMLSSETIEEAIARELDEELNLRVLETHHLYSGNHFYDARQLDVILEFVLVRADGSRFKNWLFHDVRLVDTDKVASFDLLDADREFWPDLLTKLRSPELPGQFRNGLQNTRQENIIS